MTGADTPTCPAMMKRLLLTALAALPLLCQPALADDGWQLVVEDDDTAVYVQGPTSQVQMKTEGLGIRIRNRHDDTDMGVIVKAGCNEKQLYVIGGMDMDPDDPIKDALVMPPMKQFTWDAPDGTVYGKIREMMCGQ